MRITCTRVMWGDEHQCEHRNNNAGAKIRPKLILAKRNRLKQTGEKCVPIIPCMHYSVRFPVSLLSRTANLKCWRRILVAGKRYIRLCKWTFLAVRLHCPCGTWRALVRKAWGTRAWYLCLYVPAPRVQEVLKINVSLSNLSLPALETSVCFI